MVEYLHVWYPLPPRVTSLDLLRHLLVEAGNQSQIILLQPQISHVSTLPPCHSHSSWNLVSIHRKIFRDLAGNHNQVSIQF